MAWVYQNCKFHDPVVFVLGRAFISHIVNMHYFLLFFTSSLPSAMIQTNKVHSDDIKVNQNCKLMTPGIEVPVLR